MLCFRQTLQHDMPVKGDEVAMSEGRIFLRDFTPVKIAGVPSGRLWHHRDITQQKRDEARVERLALYDVVTGLPNRRLLRYCFPCSFPGSSNSDCVEPDGRQADTDRDALPILAAGPDSTIEFEVVSDPTHPGQYVRAIADQRGSLDRGAQLAIFDLVGFAQAEYELATRDVYLPTAEGDRVEPVVH